MSVKLHLYVFIKTLLAKERSILLLAWDNKRWAEPKLSKIIKESWKS